MTNCLDDFQAARMRMNGCILSIGNLGIKRFFNLDIKVYTDGVLSAKEKELLGLVASMVLRCNDCIDYHILQCVQTGWKDEELYEAFNVALLEPAVLSFRTFVTRSRASTWLAKREGSDNHSPGDRIAQRPVCDPFEMEHEAHQAIPESQHRGGEPLTRSQRPSITQGQSCTKSCHLDRAV